MFGLVIPAWVTKQLVAVSLILLFVLGCVGLYVYIGHLNSEIDSLNAENSQLKTAISEQKKTIDTLTKNYQQIIKEKDSHSQKEKDLEKKLQKLRDELKNKKFDSSKQKDVQDYVNNLSSKTFNCLEKSTGKVIGENCD